MPKTTPRRATADVAAAAAAYFVAGGWLASAHAPDPISGLLAVGTGATVMLLLGAIALALDAVDGPVARRTRSASDAGARLDTETDAALTRVLSCAAAAVAGLWVLLIGLLYYAFAAAGRFRPALRKTLPPSRARKAIGAFQPCALLLALTPGIPAVPAAGLLFAALALLLFSFGRDVAVLERRGPAEPVAAGTAGTLSG